MGKKNKRNKHEDQELEDKNKPTGGQYIDADIDESPENEQEAVKKTGLTLTENRPQSDKGGSSKGSKNKFVVQVNVKDNTSLRSSQKGNKLLERDEMIQPLVNNDMKFEPNQENQTDDNKDPEGFFEMLAVVTKLAIGPIVSMIFQQLIQLINTYSVGHTNDAALIAGVGMGNMLINILAFAIMQGLNGALESLCSQAYGASNNVGKDDPSYKQAMREKVGQLFNKGRFICTIVMIPIAIIFSLSDKILIGLGQDPQVAKSAQVYCTILIPGVWALGQFDATKKFLSAQYSTQIPVWTQLGTTIFHFLWCYLFITKYGMRERGAAYATNITWIANMVISDSIIRWRKDKDYEHMVFWYNKSVLNDIGMYLKIGIPGMLMLCCEWWIFELLAIFTGLLGVDQLAAEVVIINLIAFVFMIPLGISYSASALTGNYLGENKIDTAKKFAQMTVFFNIMITSVVVLILGLAQDWVAALFTSEPKVVQVFKETMWVLLLYIWFDTIHGVQSGIIRGLGRQMFGFFYTMVCYVIIGLPLALVLCFKAKMGIAGLWLGMTIACIALDVGFAFIISCPNWQKIATNMRSQIEAGEVPRTPEVSNFRANKEKYTPQIKRKSVKQSRPSDEFRDMEAPGFGGAQNLEEGLK